MRAINPTQKKPAHKLSLKIPVGILVFIALISGIVLVLQNRQASAPDTQKQFNKSQYSINDPTSIWAVVNKGRLLPADYIPPDLVAPNVPLRLPASDPEMQIRSVAAAPLQQMFKAAKEQNLKLMVSSGYRSYNLQESLYRGYVSAQGQQKADSSSARPGHSEHQTGLALDVEPSDRTCEVEPCFADTPEGKWLASNAYRYGFIIRYEKGQEELTGYEYEPWHLRYIGVELSQQIHKTNQTLEQFFKLPKAKNYPAEVFQLRTGN